MDKPLYIRPSLWPIVAEHCPSAAQPVDYVIERPNVDRQLGSANHQLYAMHNSAVVNDLAPVTDTIQPDDIVESAAYFGVDPLALSALWERTRDGAIALWPFMQGALTYLIEESLPGGGTCDFAALDVDDDVAAIVVDLKKREGPDHRHQIIRYADGVRQILLRSGISIGNRKIKGIALYAEGGDEGTYRVWDFAPEDFQRMQDHEEDVRRKIGRVYNPGDHCAMCPGRATCGPLEEFGRGALRVMDMPVEMLSLASVGEAYLAANELGKRIADFRKWARIALMEADVTVPIGNGKELYIQTQSTTKLDVRRTWGALREYGFNEEDMARVTEISKGDAVKVVRDDPEKRFNDEDASTKKAAEERLVAYLEARECITHGEIKKLATRKERK